MTTLDRFRDFAFQNPELLDLAFTHKSFNPQAANKTSSNNERLEFLGDAVLDLILSDLLMKSFPNDSEGDLTKKRANLVNEATLYELAQVLGLDLLLKVGKAEKESGLTQNSRILASSLEALVGALYLDQGYGICRDFVQGIFQEKLANLSENTFDRDYKTQLQEISQKKNQQIPEYLLIATQGPEHQKVFEIEVKLNGEVLAKGVGKSKKQAEQVAAKLALEVVNVI